MTEPPQLEVEVLLTDLNAAAHGVFRASNKLQRLTEEFDGQDGELGVGTRYQIALEDELTAIYEDAKKAEERPPAEDIRSAMAHARVRAKHPDLDADFRRLSTEMKAMQVWISTQRAVLSARQTVLNGVRGLAGT